MELLFLGVILVVLGLLARGGSHKLVEDAVAQREDGASIAEAGPEMGAGLSLGCVAMLLVLVGGLILIAVVSGGGIG